MQCYVSLLGTLISTIISEPLEDWMEMKNVTKMMGNLDASVLFPYRKNYEANYHLLWSKYTATKFNVILCYVSRYPCFVSGSRLKKDAMYTLKEFCFVWLTVKILPNQCSNGIKIIDWLTDRPIAKPTNRPLVRRKKKICPVPVTQPYLFFFARP